MGASCASSWEEEDRGESEINGACGAGGELGAVGAAVWCTAAGVAVVR